MVHEAVTKALKDAKLTINQINQACVGYVYGMKITVYINIYF